MNKKIYRYQVIFFVMIGIAIFFTSCSFGPKLDVQSTYKSPNLKETNLENMNLAILPIIMKEGLSVYKRPFASALSKELSNSLSVVLDAGNSQTKLVDAGLFTAYKNVLEGYRVSGVFDRTLLLQISNQIECDYVLISELNISGWEVRVSGGYPDHVVETHTKIISANSYLWSAKDSTLLWEGNATFRVGDQTFKTDIELCELLGNSLSKELINSLR